MLCCHKILVMWSGLLFGVFPSFFPFQSPFLSLLFLSLFPLFIFLSFFPPFPLSLYGIWFLGYPLASIAGVGKARPPNVYWCRERFLTHIRRSRRSNFVVNFFGVTLRYSTSLLKHFAAGTVTGLVIVAGSAEDRDVCGPARAAAIGRSAATWGVVCCRRQSNQPGTLLFVIN